jgi:hypothetical protein
VTPDAAEATVGDEGTASSLSSFAGGIVSWPGLTHTDFVEGPPDGNRASRTVQAAAVPPTAVRQYASQPTKTFVRRRGRNGRTGALEPRST